jgi:histidine triad (HIT) family protein
MAKPDPVLDALTQASKGLLLPSETEAPLEPFAWPDCGALTAKRVQELSGTPTATAVDETTLDDLLRTVPSEGRARFQTLARTLEAQLAGIKVYKFGDQAEKMVYIVGKTPDGRWAGLKTMVVET